MTQEERNRFLRANADGSPSLATPLIVLLLLIRWGRNLPESHRVGPLYRWQLEMCRFLVEHRKLGLMGCRQASGKTYVVALYIVSCLLLGWPWATFMPTLIQATRILVRRVSLWMTVLEPHFGLERTKDEERERNWDNGAAMLALSSNPEAQTGIQGYTIRGAALDESHEVQWADVGNFTALLKTSEKQRREKLVIFGVSGFEQSAIEQAGEHGYPVLRVDDVLVSALDDAERAAMAPDDPRLMELSWREVFSAEEREHPETYDQYYRLLPVRAGGRLMFGELPEYVEPASPYFMRRKRAGIDVGKIIDETVLVIDELRGRVCNTLAVYRWRGCDYRQQRDELAKRLRAAEIHSGDVAIGVAGPGEVLADMLAEWDEFEGIARVKETDAPGSRVKTHWLKDMMEEARQGRWGVADIGARRELANLTYTFTPKGEYIWPHSDLLAAAMISHAAEYRAMAL